LKTVYFSTKNSGHETFDNIQHDGTFKPKFVFLHFERNRNKLVALKQLVLLDIALAVEHLEVHLIISVLVDHSNDVQVTRVDGHLVDVVFEELLESHLLHSHVHVTGRVVCHTLWLDINFRCASHVTRAIHLVYNDPTDDQPIVLHARDVRLVQ
jgi:hypothetical protein